MSIVLVSAAIAWGVAQGSKFVLALRSRTHSFRVFITSGGMPSSHTATVVALAVAIGLHDGFASSIFSLAIIFAAVVAYDAMGVRRASGEHARLLNRLVDRLAHPGQSEIERLREELGHRPLEVAAGIIVGVVTAAVVHWVAS